VGLQPSAIQGEARLRGLWRREYSSPSVHIRHIRANPCSIPTLRGEARLCGRNVARAGWSPWARGSPCVPSSVSGIRTLKLPLLPLWEKGAGGMRGKRRGNAAHRASLPRTLPCEGNTPHHPRASVIAAPIRGLFRLSKAKPACAGWRVPSGWSPRLCKTKPACAGYGGIITQRP